MQFLLPSGTTVDVRAHEVIFQLVDSPDGVTDPMTGEVLVPAGRSFDLRVDAPAVEGTDAGVAGYRAALDGLGLPGDTVRELEQKIEAGPTGRPRDASARVGVSASLPRTQGMQFGVGTLFSPDRDVAVFLLEYFADWDVVPIP